MKTPVIFDNDCISSSLWVNRTDIIKKLFPKQIIIPSIVCNEIQKVTYLYGLLQNEIETKNFITQDIEIGSNSYIEYLKLISPNNEIQIDPGEAAAIIIARENNGTMASNNLKDILHYVKTEEPP